jgi:hypothetical protein
MDHYSILKHIDTNTHLIDSSVALTSSLDIVPVPNSDFIYNYALLNPNTTSWGVSFNEAGTGSAINIQYQLWFNATATANGSDIFGRTVLSFVRGLDEAIISTLNDPSATITADISINVKDWPLIAPTVLSDTIVQQLGPVFFFCSEMLIFINVLNQIVTEKELKLRHGMEVMGLKVFTLIDHSLSHIFVAFCLLAQSSHLQYHSCLLQCPLLCYLGLHISIPSLSQYKLWCAILYLFLLW